MTSEPVATQARSADGTTIAYERAGSGPPLVMVDPAGGYRGFGPIRELGRRLATDFTVVTYDRRGRGLSTDTLPYRIEREVEDLAALTDALGEAAFLFGYSSGGGLALRAAASGLPITRLAVFEPPIATPAEAVHNREFTERIADLVGAGQRAEAVEAFHSGIGVPPEALAGMDASSRAALDAIAHTLVYDCIISAETTVEVARRVAVPTLVLDSEGTTGDLPEWAQLLVHSLPHGTARSLPGSWHGVSNEDLAAALAAFFVG